MSPKVRAIKLPELKATIGLQGIASVVKHKLRLVPPKMLESLLVKRKTSTRISNLIMIMENEHFFQLLYLASTCLSLYQIW